MTNKLTRLLAKAILNQARRELAEQDSNKKPASSGENAGSHRPVR